MMRDNGGLPAASASFGKNRLLRLPKSEDFLPSCSFFFRGRGGKASGRKSLFCKGNSVLRRRIPYRKRRRKKRKSNLENWFSLFGAFFGTIIAPFILLYSILLFI